MLHSKAHQNFCKAHHSFFRPHKKSKAHTNPQVFLGPNYQTILNFWWFMDSLTEEQWDKIARRYRTLIEPRMWRYATNDAYEVARDAVGSVAYAAGNDAAGYTAFMASGMDAGVAVGYAAETATYELIGCIENPVIVPLFEGFVAG